MAGEEAESVGGISITAGIDDSRVDAELNALLARLQARAEHAQIGIPIGVVPGAAPAGGGGRPAAQPQAPAIRLVGAGGRGGRSPLDITDLAPQYQKQLADALQVQGASATRTAAASLHRATASAATDLGRQAAASPTEVAVTFDTAKVEALFTALLTKLQVSADTKAPTIKPKVARAQRGGAVAGEDDEDGEGAKPKALRRKNIRDRGIGTEANAGRVYTYDPQVYAEQDARATAKSHRLMETIASSRENAPQRATPDEQRLLAALTGPLSGKAGRPDDRRLRELSYEAQASGSAARTSATFASQMTPAQITDLREASARRFDERQRSRPSGPPSPPPPLPDQPASSGGTNTTTTREQQFAIRQQQAAVRRQFQEAQIQRSQEQARITQEAAIASAGRTARTTASSLGSFFGFGPRRGQIEAQTELQAARQQTASATRYRSVFENEMIANEVRASTATKRHARDLRDTNKAIRESVSYKDAVRQQGAAFDTENAATEKLAATSTGLAVGLRGLFAVTAGGAAFGLGLAAVGVAIKGIETVAAPLFDQFTGYAQTSAKLTGALADQSRQSQNNVNTTVQLAAAQSGLSQSSRDLVTPLIAERTQTEAGNKAFVNLADSLKAVNAIRQQDQGLPAGMDVQLIKDVTGAAGTGIGGTKSTAEILKDSFNQIGRTKPETAGLLPGLPPDFLGITPKEIANNLAQLNLTTGTLNGQLKDAGDSAQQFVQGSDAGRQAIYDLGKALKMPELTQFADSLQANGNNIGVTGVQTPEDVFKLLQALTRSTVQPAAQLRAQLDIQRPLNIGAVGRELSYALRTQLPVQAGLTGITSPLAKVGTGIAAANPAEQSRITGSQKLAIDLQSKLNTYYDQGKNILETTYRTSIVQNFGEATAQAYDKALAGLKQVSAQIVDIQSKISNESAAYQTAQYNYQLVIAKRTLSDIGGLTNQNFGAGQSYLGVLERQNLALSRQGQMLGFALSQRQINFQTAIAGFEAPGVTPAERQARIAEAKVEAGFAQKQLDIQKQMFGNQVQIVDISNLRQGVDLAKQVGLLLQGRRVTVDTQIAQEQLGLLAKAQGQLVDEVSAYTSSVATLAGQAMTEISQLEAAAGSAMSRASQAQIGALYGYFAASSTLWSTFLSQASNPTSGNQGSSGRSGFKSASGSLFTTQGATNMTVGEAGAETVAVLRNPRQFMGDLGGGGGGTTIIDVHDNALNSQADMDTLVRKIEAMIGRKASQIGLRTGN